jgi:hypothetical protein
VVVKLQCLVREIKAGETRAGERKSHARAGANKRPQPEAGLFTSATQPVHLLVTTTTTRSVLAQVHIPFSTPGSRQDLAAAQLELAPSMEAESPLLASATRALQSRPSLYSSGGNLYGFVAECSSDCPSHASWSNYLGQRYTCLPGHYPLPSSVRFHDWICLLKRLGTPTGPQPSP